MGEMVAPSTLPEQRDFYYDDDVRAQIVEQIEQQCVVFGRMGGQTRNPFDRVEGMYSEVASAVPDERALIPEEGAWVIVNRVPHTVLDFDVPRYSIWRARPIYTAREFKRVSAGGRSRTLKWPMLKGRISTPGGELDLFPGEYVVTDITRWLELLGEGVTINFMGAGEPGELEEQVFYMQAHGIPRRDALVLALPLLTDDSFAYFTLEV